MIVCNPVISPRDACSDNCSGKVSDGLHCFLRFDLGFCVFIATDFRLGLEVSAMSDGTARFRIFETNPIKPRFEVCCCQQHWRMSDLKVTRSVDIDEVKRRPLVV